jgi:Tfp pilus assembly protein PilF
MSRIETLLEYLRTTPNDSFLQHALALEYIKTGNDVEAKNLFENILAAQPSYVGSYYHLAKLLERQNNNSEAIAVYKNGMVHAKAAKDNHSYNELMMALEDLED